MNKEIISTRNIRDFGEGKKLGKSTDITGLGEKGARIRT